MTEKQMMKKKTNWNRILFMISMMILPVANWFIFHLYCSIDSYLLSFQNDSTGKLTFDNYIYFWKELTTTNGEIYIAVINSFKFFTLQVALLFANFIFAYFLYKKIFLYKVFRIIFYLPTIFSGVVMTSVFMEFIKPMGPLGTICKNLGIPIRDVGLLGHESTALITCFIYSIWTGFSSNVLLFNGALARIPQEVIEAGKLDGCKPMREAFSLIFPLVWPTFSTMLVFMFTGILSSGGVVQLLTGGEFGTMTLAYWMFEQLYGGGSYGGSGQYGVLAAGSIMTSLATIPLILFVRWLTDRIPAVEY